jgi:phospholipid/cholesterol/gamma-HCH transport system substrate-binding protein
MSKKLNNEVLLGGFIVVAGGLLAYMSVAVGGLNMTPGLHVAARFVNASGLVKDAVVSVAGVQVGHIERLEVDHDMAIVHFFIRREASIRKDVKAAIRAKSLLGEKYLELQPQSRDAALLVEGDVLTATRPSVEVDEVLAALGPVLKKVNADDLATIVRIAARTLNNNEGNIDALMKHANSVTTQLDALVHRNGNNIDRAAANIASLSSEGDAILRRNRPQIERTVARVDHLTGVLDRETPSLMAKSQRITTNVDGMAARLNHEAPTLIRDAKRTLVHADAALVKVPGTLDSMDRLGKGVDKTLKKVNPLLDKANQITPGNLQDFAHEALARTGIKVYVHPFGPSEEDYRRLRAADDAVNTTPSAAPKSAIH